MNPAPLEIRVRVSYISGNDSEIYIYSYPTTSSLTLNETGLWNPNITGCDYFYCTEVCLEYAYCDTEPNENCANQPEDCLTRCETCDSCMDDPAGYLTQVGGCDSIIDFLGGPSMYCETDLARWDLTGLMPTGIYFGWMVRFNLSLSM